MPEMDPTALLKRFEPVLKFTQGEQFYPYSVGDYVAESSLWEKAPDMPPVEIETEAALNLAKLGTVQLKGAQKVHYLNFISPMNLRELAEYRFKELRQSVKERRFKPSRSRLARVGYLARLVDAAFSVSLLLRGRVPGDATAAAVETFNAMLERKRAFQYYGRVIRQNGWIVLQYWYFYPFNNWRSGFYGANDHEADWEMVNLYCYEDEGKAIQPAWVAYACHDFSGDDLRRHWEDPELEKIGEHPVVYAGGGSHASYFQQGEYLTQLSLGFLKPIHRSVVALEKFFGKLFHESLSRQEAGDGTAQVFTIPFVDYALGDGLSIGFGCKEQWSPPVVIDPPPGWVKNYRGLWGYYAQDPFSGEDAPSGPRYNRDGTVRRAWYDPLGWAGMEKVVPPTEQQNVISQREEAIRREIVALRSEVDRLQAEVYQTGVDLRAMQDAPNLRAERAQTRTAMAALEADLAETRRLVTVRQAVLEALEQQGTHLLEGEPQQLRAHIRHAHQPYLKQTPRFGKFAEVWAAISIGLMMIAIVVLFLFARQFVLVGLLGMVLLLVALEAAFQRRLWALVRGIALTLAVIAFLILFVKFFWIIVGVIVMVIGFYMIVENLQELFARR